MAVLRYGPFRLEESAAFHYGLCAFEGILCWKQSATSRMHLFRLEEHLERMRRSMAVLGLQTTRESLRQKMMSALQGLDRSAYVRPLAYSAGSFTDIRFRRGTPIVKVFTQEMSNWLFLRRMQKPLKGLILEEPRLCWGQNLSAAKVSGKYVCFLSAQHTARMQGYDHAILLDAQGRIVEAATANLILVRGDALIVPKSGERFPGITLDSLRTLARELGMAVHEEEVMSKNLVDIREALLTSTARGVVRLGSIRCAGTTYTFPESAVWDTLRKSYLDVLNGLNPLRSGWMTPVPHQC